MVSLCQKFRNLGAIIKPNGGIDLNIANKMLARWATCRQASGVMCRRVPCRIKGRFFNETTIMPIMLYRAKCWAIKKQLDKVMVKEMFIPKQMSNDKK